MHDEELIQIALEGAEHPTNRHTTSRVLAAEVRRLRARVDELLHANNAMVERVRATKRAARQSD